MVLLSEDTVKQLGKFTRIIMDVRQEFENASSKWRPFISLHESYAILLEEMDELWEEVKKSQKFSNNDAVREEAIQVAAMAIRLIYDCCDKE